MSSIVIYFSRLVFQGYTNKTMTNSENRTIQISRTGNYIERPNESNDCLDFHGKYFNPHRLFLSSIFHTAISLISKTRSQLYNYTIARTIIKLDFITNK